MVRFRLKTKRRCELVDITEEVSARVSLSGIKSGVVVVYCPHTTAGITINENADPSVKTDISMKTEKLVGRDDPDYRHSEGNSDGHLKSSLFGASETVIVEEGSLVLGTWQGICFAEFDGPRTREVFIKIMADRE